jgi:hypothetical protein
MQGLRPGGYHRESNKVLDALVRHRYIARYPQNKV